MTTPSEPSGELARLKVELERIGSMSTKLEDQLMAHVERLESDLRATREKLARIEDAARADAVDLENMRDGTKLTRAGLVMALKFLQEESEERREKLAEAEAAQFRAERNERDLREEVSAAFRKHGLAAGPQAVDRIIEQRESLRAQNLALEAQVGEAIKQRDAAVNQLADAMDVLDKIKDSPGEDADYAATTLHRIENNYSHSILDELREQIAAVVPILAEYTGEQECRCGDPNCTDNRAFRLLTTLTGEKK